MIAALPMKMKTYLLLLVLLVTSGWLCAQNVPAHNQQKPIMDTIKTTHFENGMLVPKKKYKNKKDHARFGIKYYYNAESPQMVRNLQSDYQNSGYVDIIRKSTFGPSLRIPLGRTFYLQTEALFGLYSNWEAAAEGSDKFWDQFSYCLSNRTGSYMWVPLYVGVRWAPATIFALKGFVGPQVDFLLTQGNISFVKDYYSVVAGAGLDLFRVFSFELGYRVAMNRLSVVENSGHWFLATSLMF